MALNNKTPNIRTNHQYDLIRKSLESRNLYSPVHPYALNNTSLVNAINSIASFIPGKSFDLTNTVIGRSVLNVTPIAKIGLQQYSKQLAQSILSYAVTDALPTINFRNLFDGNPNTRLITKQIDYRITRDETKTTIGSILEDITNQSPKLQPVPFTGKGNLAPFDKFPNFFDYLRNTGKGQLNQYYGSIGKNMYMPSSQDYISASKDQGYKVNYVSKALLTKTFFSPNNSWEGLWYASDDDPDFSTNSQAASDDVRSEIVLLREDTPDASISEYGSTQQTGALGKSAKPVQQERTQTNDLDFDESSFGFNEGIDNQIIWGNTSTSELTTKFGARSGMLLYTKGLLQAKGRRGFFNQTKEKYTDRQGRLMYNGSPLTQDINGTLMSGATGGLRQHTIFNQYNTFAKAIRFEGNQIYDAPAESVINKTVIPKFHPVIGDNNVVDNKNMMFTIENLAYILNDEGYNGDMLGTKVPKSEVGANKGRLMWFAPYDVQVSETASAKYESTQFIGRSEPIYSYQTSERSARLSFKLIVDYPPQVDGKSHGDNAKFFAFGGKFKQDELKNIDINKLKSKNVELKNELDLIKPKKVLRPPDNLATGDFAFFYFHNDGDSVQNDIDNFYEDGVHLPQNSGSNDSTNFGLNKPFSAAVTKIITQTLNPANAHFYKVEIIGSASRLFYDKKQQAGYNKALGLRRANSLLQYLEKAFKAANNGQSFAKAGIQVSTTTIGSDTGSTAGALTANISKEEVKKERYAFVRFSFNGTLQEKDAELTPSQITARGTLQAEIDANNNLIAKASKAQLDERIFVQLKKEDRIQRGFEAMRKITFSPAFHSQTPEDFHRRLTFLHQCTRQGNAVINNSTVLNGVATARNSAFGRPPVCVFRLGDMFHSKIIIETVDFDYSESVWDVNPEGMGMQFMIANIDISMKIIGGQSLKAAIDVIQNAESFNYYANSTYYNKDVYQFARKVEDQQVLANTTLINAKQEARFGKQQPETTTTDLNENNPALKITTE